ncbi:MAG: hypothetical protein WB992_18470 [Bryobacteraceae bacterium]
MLFASLKNSLKKSSPIAEKKLQAQVAKSVEPCVPKNWMQVSDAQ